MSREQRHVKMTKYIINHKEVTVGELAQKFTVSEMTVRRDLDELEQNHLIRRTRGGAIAKSVKYIEESYSQRSVSFIKEKKQIARTAIHLIDDGDTLVLDSGTTMQELAKLLYMKKNLNVVINDFLIYDLLKENDNLNLFFTGGQVSRKHNTVTLGMANRNFYQNIHVDKAFISTLSINFDSGLYHSHIESAESKQDIIASADQIILLVDHTKFESGSMFKVASIDKIDVIVTDDGFREQNHKVPKNVKIIKEGNNTKKD